LRIRGDASRDDRLDRLCTREVARWYPEIYEGIDWDEVDDQTKESRRHTSGLSLLERYRERKRAFQTNPLTEETTSPHG